MNSNLPILLDTLMEKAVSIYQNAVQGLSPLNRAIQKLLKAFIGFMGEQLQTLNQIKERLIAEVGFTLGYSETKPSMLSKAYTHFCVRKRSKLDYFLNTPPQRMVILKPNMLCKLKV